MRNSTIDFVSDALLLQPIPISIGPNEIQIWFQIIQISITSLFDNEPLTIIIPKYAIETIYVSELEKRAIIRADEHEYCSIQVLCTPTSPLLFEIFTRNEEFSRGLLGVPTVCYESERQLQKVGNLLSTHNLIEIPDTNKQILTMNNDGDLLVWLTPEFALLEICNVIKASVAKFGWKVI